MSGRKDRSRAKRNNLKVSSGLPSPNAPSARVSSVAELSDSAESALERKEQDGVVKKCADTPPTEFMDALGVSDHEASVVLLGQALSTIPNLDIKRDLKTYQKIILTILRGIGPKDTIEGAFAVQLVGTHQTAMHFLARAVAEGNSMEVTDANVNRANKLIRTFIALTEGLNHHRGKIPQPMVVGNVNVSDGGQAIVGSVNHPGSGKASKDNEEKTVE